MTLVCVGGKCDGTWYKLEGYESLLDGNTISLVVNKPIEGGGADPDEFMPIKDFIEAVQGPKYEREIYKFMPYQAGRYKTGILVPVRFTAEESLKMLIDGYRRPDGKQPD